MVVVKVAHVYCLIYSSEIKVHTSIELYMVARLGFHMSMRLLYGSGLNFYVT